MIQCLDQRRYGLFHNFFESASNWIFLKQFILNNRESDC
jgi:hypothetical protein